MFIIAIAFPPLFPFPSKSPSIRWRRNSKLPFDFFGSVWSNLDSLRYHQELTDLTLIVQVNSTIRRTIE
jgi:hypothetical protein